ncbi:hypothetical protein B0H17DRAFT_1194794 [Mycena rosella]|uniref:Uncharacterized protein n=1 Tax=Mycena rosella TaxID=1033263 RepID=A0AAD7E053_MYCRO|nr:hypothetical protein B0H17DRAFT_1194794 [Mycena rosella]
MSLRLSSSLNNPFLQPQPSGDPWTEWAEPRQVPAYANQHPQYATPTHPHTMDVPRAPNRYHYPQHYADRGPPMYAHQQPAYGVQYPQQAPPQMAALFPTPPPATSSYCPRMPPLPPLRPAMQHRVAPPLPPRPQPHQAAHPESQDMASSASGHIANIGPVPKVFALSTAHWTSDQRLCLESRNWILFSVKVRDQLGMAFPGARRFIEPENDDPNICLSFQFHPAHYRAWKDMDQVVRLFLSDVCAPTEHIHIQGLAMAKIRQLAALKVFSAITYPADATCLTPMTLLLMETSNTIWQCGPFDPEAFLVSGIINALQPHYPELARAILHKPGVTLADVHDLITAEQAAKLRELAGGTVAHAEAHAASTTSSAPARDRTQILCSNTANCPKLWSHTWPYCTSKGGGMEGKTVE